jgi:hypothetical protein
MQRDAQKRTETELSYSEMIPEQFPELERIIRVTFRWPLPDRLLRDLFVLVFNYLTLGS